MSIGMIVVWWLKSSGMTVLNALDNISPDIIYAGNRYSSKLPSISTDINLGFQSAPKSTPRFGLYRVSRGIIF